MHGCRGNNNLGKRVSPYFTYNSIEIKRYLDVVDTTIRKTNPDYDIIKIKKLHLYYDMKLVTFSIDRNKNLIIQFPVFIQQYTQHGVKHYGKA